MAAEVTERYLTTRSVAQRLGVAPRTVLTWAGDGKIPSYRLPSGELRFDEDELDAWLVGRATPPRGVSSNPRDAARAVRLSSARSSNPEDEE